MSDIENALEDCEQELETALDRIADLEAQLAAFQWRPANEPGIEAGRYETVSCPPRAYVIYDHMRYIPGEGWTGGAQDRAPDYYRPILPPPQQD